MINNNNFETMTAINKLYYRIILTVSIITSIKIIHLTEFLYQTFHANIILVISSVINFRNRKCATRKTCFNVVLNSIPRHGQKGLTDFN